ncbi:hypothetical protein ACFX15_027461 [Malus domestica]
MGYVSPASTPHVGSPESISAPSWASHPLKPSPSPLDPFGSSQKLSPELGNLCLELAKMILCGFIFLSPSHFNLNFLDPFDDPHYYWIV